MRRILSVFAAALVGLVAIPLALSGRFGVEPTAAAAVVPLKVITWNICGEFTGCPKTSTAAEITSKRNAIKTLIDTNQADAILLNETCEWYANTLLTLLNGGPTGQWQLSFHGARQNDTSWPGKRTRTCTRTGWSSLTTADHALGVAILTKGAHDQTTAYELTSPTAQYTLSAPLLCVRKTGASLDLAVRLCVAHFTPPGYDNVPDTIGNEPLRRQQAARVAEVVTSFGNERVVVGGDLNLFPPAGTTGTTVGGVTSPGTSTKLNPLYDLMRECAQAGTGRSGPATTHWDDPTNGLTYAKLDYLFARSGGSNAASLVTACPQQFVSQNIQTDSDHAPIVGAFAL